MQYFTNYIPSEALDTEHSTKLRIEHLPSTSKALG
jgi:hypothetical protein